MCVGRLKNKYMHFDIMMQLNDAQGSEYGNMDFRSRKIPRGTRGASGRSQFLETC